MADVDATAADILIQLSQTMEGASEDECDLETTILKRLTALGEKLDRAHHLSHAMEKLANAMEVELKKERKRAEEGAAIIEGLTLALRAMEDRDAAKDEEIRKIRSLDAEKWSFIEKACAKQYCDHISTLEQQLREATANSK